MRHYFYTPKITRYINSLVIFYVLTIKIYPQECPIYLYSEAFKMMDVNDPISYVSIRPKIKSSLSENNRLKRNLDLDEGNHGYSIELNLFTGIPLMQKRTRYNNSDSSIYPLLQYGKVRLIHRAHVRVMDTLSSRILPPTNSFGIDFQRILFAKIGQKKYFNELWNCEKHKAIKLSQEAQKIDLLWFSLLINHYSNGQDGIALRSFPNSNFTRNNYRSGNFSTNHINLGLHYFITNLKSYTFSAKTAIQKEIGSSTGIFSFEPLQENRYGKTRLLASMQGYLHFKQINLRLRAEGEYILDKDLPQFPYQESLTKFNY